MLRYHLEKTLLRKGWIHPFLSIDRGKTAIAARNWINFAPQTDATTFAFASVSILLLWSAGWLGQTLFLYFSYFQRGETISHAHWRRRKIRGNRDTFIIRFCTSKKYFQSNFEKQGFFGPISQLQYCLSVFKTAGFSVQFPNSNSKIKIFSFLFRNGEVFAQRVTIPRE